MIIRNKSIKKCMYLALIASIFLASESYSAVNWAFLNIPQSSREVAMGETGVSFARNGSGVWYNPAHIASGRTDVWFQGFQWITDGKGSYGGARIATDWGGVSAFYVNHRLDGFEVRDRPGPPQGEFTLHQTVFAVGTGFRPTTQATIGLFYKGMMEDIYGDRASIWNVFDVGAAYDFNYFILGAAIQNLNIGKKKNDSPTQSLRSGISTKYNMDNIGFSLAVESVVLEDEDSYLHTGVEVDWAESYFFRLGYMAGHDSRSVSTGLGLVISNFLVDFAWTPFENELGTTWRFGIGMNL